MKTKLLIGLMVGLLFMLPIAFAAEELPTTLPIEPKPGITPDSPLYGLDTAAERIQLALTFNKAEKAKLGLKFADERLAEVKTMVEANKTDAAGIAQREHERNMVQVESRIGEIEDDNATAEIGEVVALRERVNEHQMTVQRIGENLLKIKGNLTSEQQNMVTAMIATMEQTTARIKVEIQNKEESSRVKVKLQTGQSDEEVDELVGGLQEQYQLEQRGNSGVYSSNQKDDAGNSDDESNESNEVVNNTGNGPDEDTGNQAGGSNNRR